MRSFYHFFIFIFLCGLTTPSFAQWELTDGPYSNLQVNDIAEVNGHLYIATYCGVMAGTPGLNQVDRISRASTQRLIPNADTLFASFHHGLARILPGNPKVMDSINGAHIFINSPSIAFQNGMAFIASNRGVYVSADNGLSVVPYWSGLPVDSTQTASGWRYSLYVWKVVTTNQYVYCATTNGVFRSDYSFSGWQRIDQDLPPGIRNLYYEQGALFALETDGVYRSFDQGQNWDTLLTGRPVDDVASVQGVLYLSVDTAGVWRSTDTGNTWVPQNGGLMNVHQVTGIKATGGKLYCFTMFNGFFRLDGHSWSQQSAPGLYCTASISLSSTPQNLYHSNYYDVFRHKPDNSWERISPVVDDSVLYSKLRVFDDSLIMVAAQFYSDQSGFNVDSVRLYISQDEAQIWSRVDLPQSLNFHMSEYDILYGRGHLFVKDYNSLHLSRDMGQTWQVLIPNALNDLKGFLIQDSSLYVLECSPVVLKKYDFNTRTWTNIYSSGIGNNAYCYSSLMKRDSVILVIASELYVKARLYGFVHDSLVLDKKVQDWRWSTTAMNYVNSENHLLVVNDREALASEDYGQSWKVLNDSIRPFHSALTDIALHRDSLFLASFAQGVFRRDLPQVSISLPEFGNTKSEVAIYPNPTRGMLKVKLPADGSGRMEIIGMNGTLLWRGEVDSDEPVQLPPFPAGLYQVRLQYNGQWHSQSLLVQP